MKKRIAHIGAPGSRKTTSGYVIKTKPKGQLIDLIECK